MRDWGPQDPSRHEERGLTVNADSVCSHVPNGLGARNDRGLMVCARCGRPYDDKEPKR